MCYYEGPIPHRSRAAQARLCHDAGRQVADAWAWASACEVLWTKRDMIKGAALDVGCEEADAAMADDNSTCHRMLGISKPPRSPPLAKHAAA